MLNFLQRIGKSLMLPIAVLPAAALLLRLGQPDLLDIPFIAAAGQGIFDNLPILFALGIAIGLSKDGSGAAALSGLVGYFVLTHGTEAINKDINMAVLGGIISGIVAAFLYNRYSEVKLPDWLGFFSGKRFVPIITSLAMIILAGIFGYVWPPIQDGINSLGDWITGAGALGAGVFGVLNRLLLPFGLHHVLNSLVWFVFGEYNGATGDINRFFAGDPTAGPFMTGFFPIMMFGLPAAALAMIAAAKKAKRKMVTGMLLGLAFTSFLTGITEPVEFLFMFIAPVLYLIHALLTGLSMALAVVFDIHHGFGFSAGAIDYVLNFGIAQKPLWIIPIGLIYAAVYFVIFYFVIKAMDLKTPGREDDDEDVQEETSAATGDKYTDMGTLFIHDLGGRDNIKSLDNCATRLRLEVADSAAVQDAALKKHGARGVMKLSQGSVQVIVGTDVEFVANAMKRILKEEQPPADVKNRPLDEAVPAEKDLLFSPDQFVLPLEGRVLPIEDVPDQVFSGKMMGDGFAIEPEDGKLVSPIDGEVVSVFPTKHAIGLKMDSGWEVLIHVGVDTVQLNGKGFTTLVKDGQKVTKGTPLLQVDLDYVKSHAPSIVTPIIFTNLPEGISIDLQKTGRQKVKTTEVFLWKK